MQPELIGGRYRVETAIGQGGMGTVWLCRDETLHREVAVKQVGLLPGESVTDSARALREARSSAALSHRNVVTVFDVVEENGAIWLVMEHVPGRSLSELIRQDGPLDPSTVADIGAQVADGLAAAHAAGTMHRDVKPGNVLVREDGVAKISDFGIARTAGDPALTQSGFLTGTPSYFSPELARGAEPGPGSDVWALGATLYAAVEGRSPYPQQKNPVAVLHDITSGQPPRPQRAGFLEPALLRMMDRDPGSRWSMADAAHGLHRLAEENSPEKTRENTVGTTPASHTEQVADPVAAPAPTARPAAAPAPVRDRDRRRRRGPVYAVLAAAALLVVIVGIAFAAAQRGDNPGPSGTAAGPTTSSKPSKSASPSSPDTQKSSPSKQSTTSSASGTGLAAQKAFLRDYFSKAPGGTDEAWAMLGPREQAKAGGRDSFNGFWRTIQSVGVGNVVSAGSNSVEATLTYRKTDGGVSTERHRLDLVRSDGGYLIDNDQQAG
jgi:serine/threonine protein kinase